MEAMEFALGLIGSALSAVGVGLMMSPRRMAEMAGRADGARRPTRDELLQKRIVGFCMAAIGAFILYIIARHIPSGYRLAH